MYPPAHESLTPQSFYDHPSTTFINNFNEGQKLTMFRVSLNDNWPLLEFWKDRVKPTRKVMDSFIEPFMRLALARREMELAGEIDRKEEEETLLGHLVHQTQDPTILKDEVSKV